MPKYTNKYGIPAELALLLESDDYELKADYSATGLVSPPQLEVLWRRYKHDVIMDVSENIWVFQGSSIHAALARLKGHPNLLVERPITISVNGATVQMTPDLYQKAQRGLWDYKLTSVWSAIFGLKTEWEQQTNIYKFGLMEEMGLMVDFINILAILRDWVKTKAITERVRGNSDYPEVQVKVISVPVWTQYEIERFLNFRVTLHEQARKLSDMDLAMQFPCSEEERWAKQTTYPIIRQMKGGSRAASGTASIQSRDEAEKWLSENGKPGDEIVERLGEQTRCEYYCPVKDFCYQYKEMVGGTKGD